MILKLYSDRCENKMNMKVLNSNKVSWCWRLSVDLCAMWWHIFSDIDSCRSATADADAFFSLGRDWPSFRRNHFGKAEILDHYSEWQVLETEGLKRSREMGNAHSLIAVMLEILTGNSDLNYWQNQWFSRFSDWNLVETPPGKPWLAGAYGWKMEESGRCHQVHI